MRKFLIILLLPSFLTISKVVSTEKEVVYTSKEIYYLSQSDFGIYFRKIKFSYGLWRGSCLCE